jgi:thioredoxin-related protein
VAYLLDKNSELANAFGARTTPHVFLFDKDMKLVYRGAIDNNNESAAKVTDAYLEKAMINLSQGKAINPAETKATGCGIKRVG